MTGRQTLILMLLAVLAAAAPGCGPALVGGRSEPCIVPPGRPELPAPPPHTEGVAGRSVEDRPIAYSVLGCGSQTVLILAAIHGNEQAGIPLLVRLRDHLMEEPDLLADRRVVLVPVANPDGVSRGRRYNARGIDLNRNFATRNRRNSDRFGWEALSEPESRALAGLINRYPPSRVVSIHQPLACIDYDGPAETLARRMADRCGLPVRKLGAQPGSFGSWVGEDLGIPIITLELPPDRNMQDADHSWRRYGPALVEAVVFEEGEAISSGN